MPDLELMPLFPLNTVLFPYAQIMVHVFEPRYLEMIMECLREEKPFGVVLIKEGYEVGGGAVPHLVGTAVRILGSTSSPDGSLNLRIQGERRFRIRKLDEDSRPFLMGSVEPVAEQDLDNSPRTMALVSRAREDFEAWVQMQISRNGSSVQIKFPDDWAALSFAIANFLPLSNMQKQHLLELTETSERFATLIPILAQQLSEQREPNYVRVYAQDLEDWVSNN